MADEKRTELSADYLTDQNSVLGIGQVGVARDGTTKIGDGTTGFHELPTAPFQLNVHQVDDRERVRSVREDTTQEDERAQSVRDDAADEKAEKRADRQAEQAEKAEARRKATADEAKATGPKAAAPKAARDDKSS